MPKQALRDEFTATSIGSIPHPSRQLSNRNELVENKKAINLIAFLYISLPIHIFTL